MSGEDEALAALDRERLVTGLSELVRVPSPTGAEREVLERLRELAAHRGLWAQLHRHDLRELREHPDHPGEEAERDELLGLTVTLPAPAGAGERAPRLALCGHVDVVGSGTAPWSRDPFGGEVADGFVHGRGSVDMKAGVAAALHALAAVHDANVELACEPDLLAVSSEEDGGVGAFAALQRDAGYAACVIPEPTGFDVVCAQAGAVTFRGVVSGVSAHAAHRLEGVSAIDRYVPVHQALHELEQRLNAEVAHPLMAELELPYPVLVGRIAAGEWSSSVPDRLEFEGRAPVRVGETVADAIAAVEDAVGAVDAGVELTWTGGRFGSAETPVGNRFARLVRDAAADATGRDVAFKGVPWGADMRLFTARGIPTVMVGPSGIERAHAVDERVSIEDLVTTAETLIRIICRFGR